MRADADDGSPSPRSTLGHLHDLLGASVVELEVAPRGLDVEIGSPVIYESSDKDQLDVADVVLAVGAANHQTIDIVVAAGVCQAAAVFLKQRDPTSGGSPTCGCASSDALQSVTSRQHRRRFFGRLATAARRAEGQTVGVTAQLPIADGLVLSDPSFTSGVDQCVHCGLCLPACPTYVVLKTETDSPRGRIALMSAAAENRIPIEGPFSKHIDRCLGCRACEAACPSGVAYGHLWEQARRATTQHADSGPIPTLLRWMLLRVVLPRRRVLSVLAWCARRAQTLRLVALAKRIPFAPPAVRELASLVPPHTHRRSRRRRREAPDAGGEPVNLFRGCVQAAFLPNVHDASQRVLAASGKRVYEPRHQTCCGALHLHLGEQEQARALARRNIDAFSRHPGPIVSNAGGCGAMLKEYAHLLAADPSYAASARGFSEQVRDVSEVLVLDKPPALDGETTRVAYVDSCHLRNVQKVTEAPRSALRSLPGVELVELSRPDLCCGSAGVYNLLQPGIAALVLDEKVADLQRADPDVIVISNPGCFLQVIRGAREAGMRARVLHLVELIDELQGDADQGAVR